MSVCIALYACCVMTTRAIGSALHSMFAFLYVKANSKEICEEIYFPSFAVNSRLIISEKYLATPVFFEVSNSPC